MKELIKYKNGNTRVTILEDGTKIREYEGTPLIVHPESIDVKITNYCDMGCQYCHESSTEEGKHGDINKLLEVLSELPPGIELAIGGGNPLAHPDLIHLLTELKNKGFISNITINQGHIKRYFDMIKMLIEEDLVKGVGVSIIHRDLKYIKKLYEITDNVVVHVIAGLISVDTMGLLMQIPNLKVLILGYKYFGFGKDYFNQNVNVSLRKLYKELRNILMSCTVSFDNLALQQLNVDTILTKEAWKQFYMGDDFTFTMYIDAVEQQYAPTSRSLDRVSFSESSLITYFLNNKF